MVSKDLGSTSRRSHYSHVHRHPSASPNTHTRSVVYFLRASKIWQSRSMVHCIHLHVPTEISLRCKKKPYISMQILLGQLSFALLKQKLLLPREKACQNKKYFILFFIKNLFISYYLIRLTSTSYPTYNSQNKRFCDWDFRHLHSQWHSVPRQQEQKLVVKIESAVVQEHGAVHENVWQ